MSICTGDCVRILRQTGRALRFATFGLIAVQAATVANAQTPVGSAGDPSKIADLVFIDNPPTIDGKLDDEVWKTATVIDDLHQTYPVDGGIPTQRTVYKVAYDADALYIAIYAYETDPSKITANVMIQGQSAKEDDSIQIILDPYMSFRSGYTFFVNANGVQGEGLYDRPYQFNTDWQGIWHAEAEVTSEGWFAEVAIPFKSLSLTEGLDNWGFSLVRRIKRNGETIVWTSKNRNTNPNAAGILRGTSKAEQGMGLDIVPSLALKSYKENEYWDTSDGPAVKKGGGEYWKHVPSVNVFYKLTPSVTASLTANTDFSGADVDDVVVNLSRFSVFLPEKRSFFLQDSDIFGFATIQENGTPFFSRRIGLNGDGLPVDIVAGAKLSGRVANWNMGAMGVLQDNQPGVDQTMLMVGRASANVLDESSMGAIATVGDPLSDDDNALLGTDFVYRNTRLIKGKALEADAWYQVTSTAGVLEDSQSYGGSIGVYTRDGLFGAVVHKSIEENFFPALGFVNWTGIRYTEFFGGYRSHPQNSWLRELNHTFFTKYVTDIDGSLLSRFIGLTPVEATTSSGDQFRLRLKDFHEVIKPGEGFYLPNAIFVAPGEYDYRRAELFIDTAKRRPIAWHGEIEIGDFYDGDLMRVFNEIIWKPNKFIHLAAGLGINEIEMPGGTVITRLGTFKANFALSNKVALLNFVQYDNISDSAALNSRLRYEPKRGDEYTFIANYGADIGEDGQIYSRKTELILKAVRTFRF